MNILDIIQAQIDAGHLEEATQELTKFVRFAPNGAQVIGPKRFCEFVEKNREWAVYALLRKETE